MIPGSILKRKKSEKDYLLMWKDFYDYNKKQINEYDKTYSHESTVILLLLRLLIKVEIHKPCLPSNQQAIGNQK